MRPLIKSATLSTWQALHDHKRDGWLYRGQQDSSWTLSSSLQRCCDREGVPAKKRFKFEQALVREFRRAYHHYDLHAPDASHIVEWLSLMQHHGAPTRLLDFSYSIYVAAHFAVEHAEEDCAIWAVRRDWLVGGFLRLCSARGEQKWARAFCKSDFDEGRENVIQRLFFRSNGSLMVAPVNPFRLNERLRTQKGLFLMPGTLEKSFMDNLKAVRGYDDHKNVLKIIIPKALRQEGLISLLHMNVTRASLFPGLDGFAQSLENNAALLAGFR